MGMRRNAKPMRALALGGMVVAAIAVLLGGGHMTAVAAPPDDTVLDWNLNALDALFNPPLPSPPPVPPPPRPGAGQTPPVAAQHLAMVQGAVYDAVNMIDRSHEPFLRGLPRAPAWASKSAAASTAAHHVLVGLGIAPVPALPPATLTWLDTEYSASLAAIRDGSPRTPGSRQARRPPLRCSPSGRGDGRYVPFSFTCGEDPGEWRPVSALTCTTPSGPSDPFAWVAKVKPFTLKSTRSSGATGRRSSEAGSTRRSTTR